MRHISYFVLKSNLPFEQFPSLLATANCCGLELGDLNHSRYFIVKFLEVVNEELIKKTIKWFEEQQDITITLDIGTVYGYTLLAVLYMCKGVVKLANIVPVSSKKGISVAEECYRALQLDGKISKKLLKDKIIGVTGDGAFAKGNKPFKQTFIKLLDKDVPIRWDLLHLINQAHKDSRGKVIYDQEIQIELAELADDEEFADIVNADHTQRCKTSGYELIDFISVLYLICRVKYIMH